MHNKSDLVFRSIESMKENRDLMIEFCPANELEITNSMFRKPSYEKATYREIEETQDLTQEQINQESPDQLDYTLTTIRLRSWVKLYRIRYNSKIDTDYYPGINTIQAKLPAHKPNGEGRGDTKTTLQRKTKKQIKHEQKHRRNTPTQYIQIPNLLKISNRNLATRRSKRQTQKTSTPRKSKELMTQRGIARKRRNIQEFERLATDFRKSKKEYKRQHIPTTSSSELDVGDRWLGIEELISKCNPTPHHSKVKEGKHLAWTQKAQKTAEHLSKAHQGKPGEEDVQQIRKLQTYLIIKHYTKYLQLCY